MTQNKRASKKAIVTRVATSKPKPARNLKANEGLKPAPKEIRDAVNQLCKIAPRFSYIEEIAGPLTVKQFSSDFASLVRIIVGQQLSTAVASAIFTRLKDSVALTPEGILSAPTSTLSQAGLSRSKTSTCLALANAIQNEELPLARLNALDDDQVRQLLTLIRGIGPWTAEIYLLFCLNRLDAWPHSDLGLQLAYQTLEKLEKPPDTRALKLIGEELRPVRGAAAYLLWHYYRHVKSKQ